MSAILHDPFTCAGHPFDDSCEEARRRAMYRDGVRLPGLRPQSVPERYTLVRPDQAEPHRPAMRTPDYGREGQ